ncbi:hypothetical protein Nepgr_009014 [Nepenthes gracilis]|uniref:Endoplasmic reticulum transmembrane protein n=1 Tax=Nepenthes gracilis TaxID=150966 RepID=A0AAD3SA79_NEPGR|nr:hypothetical protein Nepgr_009014 [Nepenthes gracilis]
MFHLLFSVIFAEMAVILLLLFKTPLRKLVIMAFDLVKRGRGPVVVKTVAGTVFVVMMSSVYNIVDITNREVDPGSINPTDQVLMARNILDPSLMGFMLFLGLMIDRLHYYIRELRLLRKTMEAAKKQSRSVDNTKNGGSSEEFNAMEAEIATLNTMIKSLESECAAKADATQAAEAEAEAMKKQSKELLLEYDRLLEDNQNLQNQLQAIEQSLPHSEGKKNM